MVHIPREIWREVCKYLDCFTLVDIETRWLGDLEHMDQELRYQAHDELAERLRVPKDENGMYWCWQFCGICMSRNTNSVRKYREHRNKRRRA